MENANEIGNMDDALKFKTRTTSITKIMKDDAMKMLKLMGMTVIQVIYIYKAPCEAEAQCAALSKAGKVFATASEDMDSLTLGLIIMKKALNFY